MIWGGNGTNCHDFCCFGNKQGRWIFNVFLMRSIGSLMDFCAFASISNVLCNAFQWIFNDVLSIFPNVSFWIPMILLCFSTLFNHIPFVSLDFQYVLMTFVIFSMFQIIFYWFCTCIGLGTGRGASGVAFGNHPSAWPRPPSFPDPVRPRLWWVFNGHVMAI